ncbi:nucleotidyl transferase [Candidatus Woesearchaeota archaeon]|nr:nucleotidyl transferase [Candidatus Woesearchaeota archaeon]MCF7901127.1 nucleotidyl transferase [Candidatus Woesearchaeota archaeon]MCF8012884.1 nucleotidyl transferase [Candidatus Woesearchaeota archaeon]
MKLIIPMAETKFDSEATIHSTPNTLISIAGKPLICHLLDSVSSLKIDKVIFIVDKEYKELRDSVKSYKFESVFIQQKEIKGVGHAIYGAKKHVQEDDILIVLGDTLVEANLKNISKIESDGVIWTKQVNNPEDFGVVFLYEDKVTRIIEKPENPISDLAVVGMYYFKNSKLLFNSLKHIISNDIKTKNAFQLTDAIQHMISNGLILISKKVDTWLDYGSVDNLLLTNNHLLKISKATKNISENSVIIRPVYIEKGAKIENSIIGPYVNIDKNAIITNSIIKNSIISKNSNVKNALLNQCFIGEESIVKGTPKKINVTKLSKVYYT